MILLSTAYLPNIQYFSKLLGSSKVAIEAHEHYQKQSYRNRCQVLSSQGVLNLTVPVIWDNHTMIRDVLIDHRDNWQRTHLRTIATVYASSPYWEHLSDRVMPLLEGRHKFLFDHNMAITQGLLDLLGREVELTLTDNYVSQLQPQSDDFRNSISPKARLQRVDPGFVAPAYYQVFSECQPFWPNLSILDLMFCDLPTARALK